MKLIKSYKMNLAQEEGGRMSKLQRGLTEKIGECNHMMSFLWVKVDWKPELTSVIWGCSFVP